jgi:hypothetical protein
LTETVSDENRSHLLEASVIQVVLSLLEAYNEKALATNSPIKLSVFELKLIRTSLGALLNASLGYGAEFPSNAQMTRRLLF